MTWAWSLAKSTVVETIIERLPSFEHCRRLPDRKINSRGADRRPVPSFLTIIAGLRQNRLTGIMF